MKRPEIVLKFAVVEWKPWNDSYCAVGTGGCWFVTARVVSKTEKKFSWFRLLMSYGQETTMHGVRYITEPNSFLCRRLYINLLFTSMVVTK